MSKLRRGLTIPGRGSNHLAEARAPAPALPCSASAPGLQREVDLHDGVLLHQRQQRAEAGRGQAGENRQRVDVAPVENAQGDVDHQDRDDQRQPKTLEWMRGGPRNLSTQQCATMAVAPLTFVPIPSRRCGLMKWRAQRKRT